jgi:hypothetical protein
MRWAGRVAHVKETRNKPQRLVGKPERNGPFWRSGRKWENNIQKDLREIMYDAVEWIYLT